MPMTQAGAQVKADQDLAEAGAQPTVIGYRPYSAILELPAPDHWQATDRPYCPASKMSSDAPARMDGMLEKWPPHAHKSP